MTHLRAVAIAAIFVGIGVAGEPLAPFHALIAGIVIIIAGVLLERWANTLWVFIFGFVATGLVCWLQHHEIFPMVAVAALGLGGLAAASYGRPTAPPVIAILGAIVGTGIFFLV